MLLGSGLRSFLTAGDEEYHMTAYSKVHTYDDDDDGEEDDGRDDDDTDDDNSDDEGDAWVDT